MKSEALFKKLEHIKAYRQSRLEVAQWVLSHPETLPELLQYCYQVEDEISFRASWVLEFVCMEELSLLIPHFDLFFESLPRVKKDQALRPIAKICEMIAVANYKNREPKITAAFTNRHKEQMTSCCFDWLLGNEKVACKVYAMSGLYYLGTEFRWIHPELLRILTDNMHAHSAAYRARGKHLLKKLQTPPRKRSH
ncbi:hypothetical protein [Altibacter lentus]|uniref:hypothetical protein n=1 Tax=Altibacter lentus TaxID=1223410 RepID=UPI0005594742|nr:hypothetical protein [Altibacter lentus]